MKTEKDWNRSTEQNNGESPIAPFINTKQNTMKTYELIEKHFKKFESADLRLSCFSFYMATGKVNGNFLTTIQDIVKEANEESTLLEEREELIEALEKTYLQIQTLVQIHIKNGSHMLAIDTDGIRASLRNKISSITGESGEDLQNRIEGIAYEKSKLGRV